jgi:hypothetical protein
VPFQNADFFRRLWKRGPVECLKSGRNWWAIACSSKELFGMESLFESGCVDELQRRLSRLRRDQPRQWGKMSAAQMLAHCSLGLEMAAGKIRPPRALMGRILGPVIKPMVFRASEKMRRNSPTSKELVVKDDRDFEAERKRLSGLIDGFAAAGPGGCTAHPHAFFGSLTADEWAVLMYKHLDHHLRQFGA